MIELKIEIDKNNEGTCTMYKDGLKLGNRVITTAKGILKMYHTMVSPVEKAKGYGVKLFNEMFDYVTKEGLMVVP